LTSDALTVTVGIFGVFASFGFSQLFYWLGKRSARREKGELLQEIHELEMLLSRAFQEMSEHVPSKSDLKRMLGARDAVTHPTGPAGKSFAEGGPTVEENVRAILGSLVNERGEVSVPRLLREVGKTVGPARFPEIVSTLNNLRSGGDLDWDGDPADPSQVRLIRIRAVRRSETEDPTKITPQPGSHP